MVEVVGARGELSLKSWKGAQGLAEDVRYYGNWMRERALERIGHLYPPVMAVQNPDGSFRHATAEEMARKGSEVRELTVIAWLWARTVKSPNPAFADVDVPLASSFFLSSKTDKEVWVNPVVDGNAYRFEIQQGKAPAATKDGTKLGRGANFRCILSDSPIEPAYIKAEGMAGRMGQRLMAVVCEGDRGRVYLEPLSEMETLAASARPTWKPEQEMPDNPRWFSPPDYGMATYADLFTSRQLFALNTFSDLVSEAREKVLNDQFFRSSDAIIGSSSEVKNQAEAYANAVATYLGFALDKLLNLGTTICTWMNDRGALRETFSRQAIAMTWDYAEVNFFSNSGGNLSTPIDKISQAIDFLPCTVQGQAFQLNASTQQFSQSKVISSDPPYYDNIGYADLSDFFYLWLRRCLGGIFPDLFGTVGVPKAEELVATPYRHGGKEKAEKFFLDGMTQAIHNMAVLGHPSYPVTIYYAFKQSETKGESTASTGWETFLAAVMEAGFMITGTWPVTTEGKGRMIGQGTNALASSIVLVCRKRSTESGITTRRDFQSRLRRELPEALRNLQQGNVAPVDLAQSSIGPGMGIYSSYQKVVEADGSPMPVRTALALINEVLDEVLSEQEGELDGDTRWAIAWHAQHRFDPGVYGSAETLCTAKNTSIQGLRDAGIVESKAGKVRLLTRDELEPSWNPVDDKRPTVWEATQHLIRRLNHEGEPAAAHLLAQLGGVSEQARDLAYRLYNSCERQGWADEARNYNALVIAWPELVQLSQSDQIQASGRFVEQNMF